MCLKMDINIYESLCDNLKNRSKYIFLFYFVNILLLTLYLNSDTCYRFSF